MRRSTFICSGLFFGAMVVPAHAYLDPGTGSIILQAVLGSIAVAGATVSLYWQRARSFFSRDRKKK